MVTRSLCTLSNKGTLYNHLNFASAYRRLNVAPNELKSSFLWKVRPYLGMQMRLPHIRTSQRWRNRPVCRSQVQNLGNRGNKRKNGVRVQPFVSIVVSAHSDPSSKKVSANRQTRPRIVRKGKNGPRRIGPRQIPQNVGSHLSQGTRKKSPFRTKRRHPKVNSSVAEWTFNRTDPPPRRLTVNHLGVIVGETIARERAEQLIPLITKNPYKSTNLCWITNRQQVQYSTIPSPFPILCPLMVPNQTRTYKISLK